MSCQDCAKIDSYDCVECEEQISGVYRDAWDELRNMMSDAESPIGAVIVEKMDDILRRQLTRDSESE